MKIIIAGGTGYLGRVLQKYFKKDELVVFTRKPSRPHHIYWDGKTTAGNWQQYLNGADVLINLAGQSVDCRYNKANKQLIYDSRIDATAILGQAMQLCADPPGIWINASSATIYKHSWQQPMDETDGETGNDFSMDVCHAWEKEFFSHSLQSTRRVAIRTAIVIGRKSPAFNKLKWLTLLGMGAKSASGQQMVSWLHEEDFARAVDFIIKSHLSGVVNLTAPYPISNAGFMKNLRVSLHMPFGIPQPEWLLKAGAKILNTETELILKSRYVIPKKLEQAGFQFNYRRVSAAFREILRGKNKVTPEGWEARSNKQDSIKVHNYAYADKLDKIQE
ncbi:MAG: TIGR01777 family oxidoreductase [Cyclobacteriaceae bacterium]